MVRRVRALAVGAALVVLMGACGGDGPDDYSAETEAQFLATCVGTLGEAERAVCRCSYDEIVDDVAYDDFEDLDRRMNDDPDAELPDDIVDIVAACASGPVPPPTASTSTTEP